MLLPLCQHFLEVFLTMGLKSGEAPIHRQRKWQYTHIPIQPEITQLYVNKSSNFKKKSHIMTKKLFLLTAHSNFTTALFNFSSNMYREGTGKPIYIIQSYKQGLMHLHIKNTYTNSYNRSQQDAVFLNFILVNNSTCFGQTYCPSSGFLILYSYHDKYQLL